WTPTSPAARAVTPKTAAATIHDPVQPSAECSAPEAASPQPPAQLQRPSPAIVHSSKSSSAPINEESASGAASPPRNRFQAQRKARIGRPNAANPPKVQSNTKERVAPAGPHALAAVQGAKPGAGGR